MKKKNRIKYGMLVAVSSLAIAGTGAVTVAPVLTFAEDGQQGAQADTAFEITSITFEPDGAAPGDHVKVRALTNGSKHHVFSLMLEIPVNENKTEHVYLLHGENDILEGEFTIGDNWANGEHTVDKIHVTALDQSVSDYDISLPQIGTFTVTDSNEDFDPPVVESVYWGTTEAQIGTIVSLTVDVTHESDLEEMIVTFQNEEGETHSVNFENGVTSVNKDTSEWSEGTYRVTSIFVRDKAGNREYYEENDNLDEVSIHDFKLVQNFPDTVGPEVTSVTFDQVNVTPDGEVTVTAEATDQTGVSMITVEVSDRRGNTQEVYLFDNLEGKFTGTIFVNNTFLNGEYTVTHITANDTLGNVSEFVPGTDTPDLTVGTFTVSGSLQDREAPVPASLSMQGTRLKPGEFSTITFKLSDKSDIWSAGVGLYISETNELFDTFNGVLQEDGSYVCTVPIDNQWFNGQYDVRIFAQDALENSANIPTGLTITVYDSAEDYEAPEVVSVSAEKKEVKPGEVVTITAEISDASLIDYVMCSFLHDGEYDTDPLGEEALYKLTRDTDGLFKVHIPINNRWLNGEHELLIHTMDQWSNFEDDIETGVVINVSDSTEDREGPEVTSILFDKTDAVPGDEFHITAKASDPSGINFVRIYLEPNYADMDGTFNPHLIVTLRPDREGNLRATDLVDNAWINSTYEVDYIEAEDRLGNIRIYDEEEIFDLYEKDELELNFLNIHDSTHTNTDIHVSEITFDKEKVNIGDTVNVTAKVEGTATVKRIELEIADNHYDQSVWNGHVELEPDENGNITGSFRIDPQDTYWQKDVSYGIISVHVLDTNNSSRYYADNIDAEVIDDLRNIVKNRFIVDTYAEPIVNPADYSRVDRAIEHIPEDLSIYTDESVAALNAAVAAVERGKTEYDQVLVNNYANAIRTATENLVLKPADYGEVDKALAKVPKDTSIYTADSVKALNEAVNAVVRDKLMDEQADVDGYAAAINKAIDELVILKADYTKVDEALEAVPKELEIFTEESLATLLAALDAVDENKNITQQAEVDWLRRKNSCSYRGS